MLITTDVPERSLHIVSIWVHVDDRVIAVFIVRVDAVADEFHGFSFDVIRGSCGWWGSQAFLVCWWAQASAAVSVCRQVNRVLQVVVVVQDVVVGTQRVVVVAWKVLSLKIGKLLLGVVLTIGSLNIHAISIFNVWRNVVNVLNVGREVGCSNLRHMIYDI